MDQMKTDSEERPGLRIDNELDPRSQRKDHPVSDHKPRRDHTVIKDQERKGKRSSHSDHHGDDPRYTDHRTSKGSQDDFKRRSSLRRQKVEESSLIDRRQDKNR